GPREGEGRRHAQAPRAALHHVARSHRLRRISAPRTSAGVGRRLARERPEVPRHSFQCGRARDHSWSSSDRLTDWAAPPRRLGRRRSHTTSCAECANGWLVGDCRRDTPSPWLALRTPFAGGITIWLTP